MHALRMGTWEEEIQMVSTVRAVMGYMMLVGRGEEISREGAQIEAEAKRCTRRRWREKWRHVMWNWWRKHATERNVRNKEGHK